MRHCTDHFILAGAPALRVHLCADEFVVVTIDSRIGRLGIRGTGDLAAAGRGPAFTSVAERLTVNPAALAENLVRLRFAVSIVVRGVICRCSYMISQAITEMAEQRASYLGLQCHRIRNFSPEGQFHFTLNMAFC